MKPDVYGINKALYEIADVLKKSHDSACESGDHGIFTVMNAHSGMINIHCTNCGKSWSKPDLPMTI